MTEPQTEQRARQDQESDDLPDVTPNPEAKIEPPQPPPGGVDAVVESAHDAPDPAIPDPNPNHNPETEDEIPAETKEPEDTDTQATKGEPEGRPEQESPA